MKVCNEIFIVHFDKNVTYEVLYQHDIQIEPLNAALEVLEVTNLLFLHSTSWRTDPSNKHLTITWMASYKNGSPLLHYHQEKPITIGLTSINPNPNEIIIDSVLTHGLRHMAMLLEHDQNVVTSLKEKPDFFDYLREIDIRPAGMLSYDI